MLVRKLISALLLLLSLAAAGAEPVLALDVEVFGRPVRREIIALYDSRAEGQPHETRIHKLAEMPLNWLGYSLVYRDVNSPLPAIGELDRARGILTWFLEPLGAPVAVGRWIDTSVKAGLRYVVLGDVLPGLPTREQQLITRLHEHLGLRYTGDFTDIAFRTRSVERNSAVVGFERAVDLAAASFPMHLSVPPAKSHLTLEVRQRDVARSSAVVVTGPGGGFAAQSFTVFYETSTDRMVWTLNPFAFFRLALNEQRFPIPDVTTLSGRRMYFSHIDGDGWNNVSEIEGYREAQVYSSEVIAKAAIEAYPDLPVSVALISGDVLPLLGGNPVGARIAKRLFALPQVEVASHTHTHPFNWQFFERYDRIAEERKVDGFQRPARPLMERINSVMLGISGQRAPTDGLAKYVAGSDDLPRTYLRNPFDLELEVQGSLKVAESLAPPGKRAMLYQWSGDTTPFEAAIRATRKAGVRNMNGGDSRLDRDYPSVAYVPAIGRPSGGERQIYSGNSNENTYTNDWTGPYFGFFMLEQTLENTDRPRRLKPFNLYYHMYSGEKPAALASIKHFLDLARRSPVVPVAASHYATVADDFYGVEIEQVGLFAWSVQRRGALQTVRFDDAEGLDIDIANSKGVLGATRHNDALYVSLDAAVGRAVVALRGREAAESDRGRDTTARGLPTLEEARWLLSGHEAEACGFKIRAEGFGSSQMTWRALPRRGFRVVAERDGRVLAEETRFADASGRLTIDLQVDARRPLTLRFACHD